MESFDYSAPAEVFIGPGRGPSRRPMRYRRFSSGAEALAFARENLPGDLLTGVVIQINDERYDADQIRELLRG